MQRKLQSVVIILVILAMVVLLGMIMYMQLHQSAAPSNLRSELHSAVTQPVDFVKNRVTGGVGAVLMMNSNGFPEIRGVTKGSPAENTGLKTGDVITIIQGKPAKGMTLAQAVDAIRGFTGGNVTLTVQRPGVSTNMIFELRRESWNAMGLSNASAPGTNAVIPPASTNLTPR